MNKTPINIANSTVKKYKTRDPFHIKVYPLSSTKSLCIGQYCHIYMDSAACSS